MYFVISTNVHSLNQPKQLFIFRRFRRLNCLNQQSQSFVTQINQLESYCQIIYTLSLSYYQHQNRSKLKYGNKREEGGKKKKKGKPDKAGDKEGEVFYDAEVTIDELVEILMDELNLPWMEPEKSSFIEIETEECQCICQNNNNLKYLNNMHNQFFSVNVGDLKTKNIYNIELAPNSYQNASIINVLTLNNSTAGTYYHVNQ